MKLNKKRISILVSLMCLLILLVFTFCSFDLPDYPHSYSEMLVTSGISSQDLTNILGIFQFQDLCGQFNSLVPLCIYRNYDRILALFAIPSYTLSFYVSNSNGIDYYNFSNSTSTSTTFIVIGLSDQGFSVYTTAYTGVFNVVRSNCLYFRSSFDSNLVLNSYFITDSSTVNSDISSVYNYWNSYASRLSGSGSGASSEELESAYSDGYDDGLETGYWIGWDEGYETGYKSGYDYGLADGYETGYGAGAVDGYVDGFDAGYDTGFDDGYSTGYDSGYVDGYDTGYSDGIEDAPPETVTIVIYEEPVEIDVPGIISSISSIPDSILSGSFDFEFAGINIYGLLKLLIIVFIISAVIFFIIKRSA